MMARSIKGSSQRPDTLMQDRTSANSIKVLLQRAAGPYIGVSLGHSAMFVQCRVPPGRGTSARPQGMWNEAQQRSLPPFAKRNVMECQAGSFRLDPRELDPLCPFFRFSRDISAELR